MGHTPETPEVPEYRVVPMRTSTRIALGYFRAECDRGLSAIVAGAIADGEVPPGVRLAADGMSWLVPPDPAEPPSP
jgi:hypothetical protein